MKFELEVNGEAVATEVGLINERLSEGGEEKEGGREGGREGRKVGGCKGVGCAVPILYNNSF